MTILDHHLVPLVNLTRYDASIADDFNISNDTFSGWLLADDDPSPSATSRSYYWLNNHCMSFEFFYNTVLIGVFCMFGIVTNVLSITVLRKDRHNRVATFLLRSLAVADICVLVVVFVVMSIFVGTASLPGVYVGYTRYAIPYLKKVNPTYPMASKPISTGGDGARKIGLET